MLLSTKKSILRPWHELNTCRDPRKWIHQFSFPHKGVLWQTLKSPGSFDKARERKIWWTNFKELSSTLKWRSNINDDWRPHLFSAKMRIECLLCQRVAKTSEPTTSHETCSFDTDSIWLVERFASRLQIVDFRFMGSNRPELMKFPSRKRFLFEGVPVRIMNLWILNMVAWQFCQT